MAKPVIFPHMKLNSETQEKNCPFGLALQCEAGELGFPLGPQRGAQQVSPKFCCKGTQGSPAQKEIPGVIWGFLGNLPSSTQVHGRAVCKGNTGLRPPAHPGERLRIPHDSIPRGKQELPPLLIPISTHLLTPPQQKLLWSQRNVMSADCSKSTSPKIQLQKTGLLACPQHGNPSQTSPLLSSLITS